MKAILIECKCETCEVMFMKKATEVARTSRHFCGRDCFNTWKKSDKFTRKTGNTVNCSNCNKEIYVNKSNLLKGKEHYCNKECMFEHRQKTGFYKKENNPNYKGGDVEVVCTYCNISYEINRSKHTGSINQGNSNFFCCKEHYNIWRSENLIGEKAYNYKEPEDRITPLSKLERRKIEVLNWKIQVFIRDNRTCIICGSKEKINAHHIMSFAKNIEQRTDINNGVTLCNCCHKEFHSTYGNKKFTPANFEEFKIIKQERNKYNI